MENNQQINFLDLCIHRKTDEFTIGIYRIPTFTNTTIPMASNHMSGHKQAIFNFLLDRAHNLPITYEDRQNKIKLISMIAKNNGYNIKNVTDAYEKGKRSKLIHNAIAQTEARDNNKIWTKFTYFGEDIRIFSKISKKSKLKIAYNVNNTIKTKCRVNKQQERYNSSGVFQLNI
jgi:hypothetical protein